MKTLLLIDGNAIFHRAYHALPDFKTKSGLHTNAVYGFFAILHKAVTDYRPTHLVICFDTPKQTFRNKLLKAYQAHRPPSPPELTSQFPMVREAIDAAKLTRLEKDGFEADDVIGTIVARYKTKDFKILILTGDKDIMQLIDKNVYVITPQKGASDIHIYDTDEVVKKFGIKPDQIPDFKALVGDPSDNYTGASGIGPKTASKLIAEFGTIENMYKTIDKIPEGRVKDLLIAHKKNVLLSKTLATIVTDVAVPNDIDATVFKGFDEKLKDTFDKFEIRSLKERIFKQQKREAVHEEKNKKKKEKDSPTDQLDMFS